MNCPETPGTPDTPSTFHPALNRLELTATVIERNALRYTPARVPVTECRLAHQSELTEAGLLRQVSCEIASVALGDMAHRLQNAGPGMVVQVAGFLAARSRNSKQLVLHIEHIEFIEGN